MKKAIVIVLSILLIMAITFPASAISTTPAKDPSVIGVSAYTGQDIYKINNGKLLNIRLTIPAGKGAASWWLIQQAGKAFEKDYIQ